MLVLHAFAASTARRAASLALALVGAATSLAAQAQTDAWTQVAVEGGSFALATAQTVRYGSGAQWVSKTVGGTVQCSNTFFGSDPAPGIVKACQVAATSWTKVAAEGGSFSLASAQTVRYGTGSRWLSKTASGAVACTNGFFGGDPAYGTAKECDVAATATAAPVPTPSGVCTPSIGAVSTAGVAPSVGTGTPASCTEAALRAAVNAHTTITFNCGAAPATIAIGSTIVVPSDRNVTIDGGGKVTLDGGGRTRILSVSRANYRSNPNVLTLQRITLANGKASGTRYVAPSSTNPSCAYGWADGAGGAVYVNDTKLHVIDASFVNNRAATPGPDVGGGAIYAVGSLDVTIVGSTFTGNSGSNSGAVGLLQSDGRFDNDVFANNVANGVGMNYANGAATGCPGVAHANQGGAGGNAGAVGIDGNADGEVKVCGATFVGNKSNELAGALFRTTNGTARHFAIDRSQFQNNSARQGGALYLSNQKPLDITASTFSGNSAKAAGAGQIYLSQLNVVNSTFANNQATQGTGGALMLTAPDAASVMRNVTFTGNRSSGGSGYFSAAIAGGQNFPIYNTVFANNTSNDAGSPMQCWFSSGSGGNDVQWPRNRVVGGAADTACVTGIAFADPLLGSLGSNGGPTATASPASNSPLRGAGRNCPATDQRGRARNTAACTVGAVE